MRSCLQVHNLMQLFDHEDDRYIEPPAFTLNDFLVNMSEFIDVPVYEVSKTVLSRATYARIIEGVRTQLFPPSSNPPKQVNITYDGAIAAAHETGMPEEVSPRGHTQHRAEGVVQRIPARQLIIEIAALLKEQVEAQFGVNVSCVVKKLPKFSPTYGEEDLPLVEIVIAEQKSGNQLANYRMLEKDIAYALFCIFSFIFQFRLSK